MPTIESLTVQQVRIIRQAEIRLSPGVNLITGPNASGKTSVLEAIYILAHGRSFRTHKLDKVTTAGEHHMLVAAHVRAFSDTTTNVGFERSRAGIRLRIRGRAAQSIGELARYLPIQVLHPESHQLIVGGPAYRRAFIDWGVFHVEQGFYPVWQRYRRALRQRNTAIRSGASLTAICAWNPELCHAALRIHEYRRDYLETTIPVITDRCQMFTDSALKLRYRPGWPEGADLQSLLEDQIALDVQRGHTRYGPHRADLDITMNGEPAAFTASRGQQKLIAAGLKLGQAQRFTETTSRNCIFLIDDLPSELDQRHRDGLTKALTELRAQIFITAIRLEDMDLAAWTERRLFHVERGYIQEVI